MFVGFHNFINEGQNYNNAYNYLKSKNLNPDKILEKIPKNIRICNDKYTQHVLKMLYDVPNQYSPIIRHNLLIRFNDIIPTYNTLENTIKKKHNKNFYDFNSYEEIYDVLYYYIKRQSERDAKKVLRDAKYETVNDYTILKISSFKEANAWRGYTSWCVTKKENMFDTYTEDGKKIFYFLFRKDYKNYDIMNKYNSAIKEEMKDTCICLLIDDIGVYSITNRLNEDVDQGNYEKNKKYIESILKVSDLFSIIKKPTI